ncbi:Rv0340 family IniB-related protein [Mycolicibacterium austroafricanum]|uniref:Rv0340 family IniB-related protein n=1 Tax=Mycolicibacterium austroafricanum TaxID=39687 RepID=UPI00055BDE5F|nr:IniB N-terminal domain-containing protein [Mycolicibacterium austroafricanum]QZY46735.1 Rv0340 family protein [Mycolicibacterium austroafricanum]
MANALLDFVMSLVRDPDAAARYAADPAQALADANLMDVTSTDVQNLIPVVAESLTMVTPTHSLDALGAEPVGNVWASGAATAAFDAFDVTEEGLPERVVIDTDGGVAETVDLFDVPASVQVDEPQAADFPAGIDDVPVVQTEPVEDFLQQAADVDLGDDAPGFDLFD